MPQYELDGKRPHVAPDAFVAPTAVLVGDVRVASGASVWFGAVLRADYEHIEVGEGANVQDNCVVHTAPGAPVVIGSGATVGHLSMVHGSTIGDACLVGNGATVLDGSTLGARALVGAHALIRTGMVVAEETVAVGVPAKEVGRTQGDVKDLVDSNGPEYQRLAQTYRAGLRLIDS